jgi:micrococcal nuclease
MKKILYYILPIFIFFIGINSVFANEKYSVTLNKCVDGDTAYFNLNEEVIKTRFLAIDTPESTNEIEEYGKEASNFTCNELTNAEKIEIEYDENSNKTDKYNRDLVWVWVDDVLLQETLLKEGLVNE